MSRPSTRGRPREEPGPRRLAREAALQMLYALDANGPRGGDEASVQRAVQAYWAHLDGPSEGRAYADELVLGVAARRDELDAAVRGANPNWRVERMARVDRNVLRLAAHELLHKDVPPQIAIDEAVELARRYGTGESSAFVNGTLDRLARTHRKL